MRFDKIIPRDRLKPYIRHFAISENEEERTYKVLPSTGLVMGFQFGGQLSVVRDNGEQPLAAAGISGIKDSFTIFKNTAGTRTILVYFTDTGLAHFAAAPVHELFNQSLSLHHIFNRVKIRETEEKLCMAGTDGERLVIVEQFLWAHLRNTQADGMVAEAVKRIYNAKGTIRIKELAAALHISQSPLEKRFKSIVGTTPKKFASIVRFNTVLQHMGSARSLTDLCYEANFFDQAHFIRDFRQYTGETPEQYGRLL